MGKILITGVTGFVGGEILNQILDFNALLKVNVIVRKIFDSFSDDVTQYLVEDINADYSAALQGVSVVIHCAGVAHISSIKNNNFLQDFRRVNVDGTLNLAMQSAAAGVRRFVFISSIGVNGSVTYSVPYNELDICNPNSLYAISKYEAELGLEKVSKDTGMEFVIIRPPMVYGRNAPGNFKNLIKVLRSGVPLPFGLIKNKRSFISVENLANFVVTCAYHPAAANQKFLISDGEDISTPDLICRMAFAMGISPRLIPIPEILLYFILKIFGKNNIAQSLLGSLQINNKKAQMLLGWKPILSLDEGLKKSIE